MMDEAVYILDDTTDEIAGRIISLTNRYVQTLIPVCLRDPCACVWGGMLCVRYVCWFASYASQSGILLVCFGSAAAGEYWD
jgi:hypothetical protein